MEIEFTLTEADILALMQYRLQRLPNLKNPVFVRRFTYMGGFMGLAVGSLILFDNIVLAIVFIVLAISSFLLYPAYYNSLLRRKVTATYRDEKTRATLASRFLRATDEGLEEKSDLGEIKLKWELVDAIEHDVDLYLYHNPGNSFNDHPQAACDHGE